MTSLSFCLKNSSTWPSLFKDIFTGCGIVGVQFSFSTLSICFHYLLASFISVEKLSLSLIADLSSGHCLFEYYLCHIFLSSYVRYFYLVSFVPHTLLFCLTSVCASVWIFCTNLSSSSLRFPYTVFSCQIHLLIS